MLYHRRDSRGFEVLRNSEILQAVPSTEYAVLDSVHINYNDSRSFYDVPKSSSASMNVDQTFSDCATAKLPSVVQLTECDSSKMPSVVPAVWMDTSDEVDIKTEAVNTPYLEIKSEHNQERNKVTNNSDEGKLDSQLLVATSQALQSGSLMPLIKEELKWSIQSKRLKEGKGELKVDFTEAGPYTLTAEEEMKVTRRRDQNRQAARRFREKQKSIGNTLQKAPVGGGGQNSPTVVSLYRRQKSTCVDERSSPNRECQRLESLNTQLRYVASELKRERDKLRSSLTSHLRACPYRVPRDKYVQGHVTDQNHVINNT